MTEPFVSIVIPAYNEEAYIQRALLSVAAQTYPLDRLECVVVDNASTDATSKVAMDFATRHPELRLLVIAEPTVGVSQAKNRGATVAQGDILVFLDADSHMKPDLIQAVVERYQSGYPAGSIRVVADSSDLLEQGFFALMELGKVLFHVRAQMLYCDRALFLTLGGFRPELKQAEDLEFLRRVREHLHRNGGEALCHVRTSAIVTSPRRLREKPFRLSLITMFLRWLLAFVGIWRTREY
jgi:glycosyltransferase involved in cell wall biosynthesis